MKLEEPQGGRFALIKQLGLPPDAVAVMGTAANMNCAAPVVEKHAEMRVCSVVTAGAMARAAVTMTEGKSAALRDLADSVLRQQAATLATSLAAKPEAWPSCYAQLHAKENALLELFYDSLALGRRPARGYAAHVRLCQCHLSARTG